MTYSKILMDATYKGGRVGQLTDEHHRAEYHRFKSQFLFKSAKIPKGIYASRLIQHLLISKAIETQLQALSEKDKAEINAFFTLSYLEQLWRTPAMRRDLNALGVDADNIKDNEVAAATKKYLMDIKQLPPKHLLTHFLFHVAGFMHGGGIIQRRYIEPSNRLTGKEYQIPVEQYDFSQAGKALATSNGSPQNVYHDMMKQIDAIDLSEEEEEAIRSQGTAVYNNMVKIYDDLCAMHNKLTYSTIAVVALCIFALALVLNRASNFFTSASAEALVPNRM